MVEFEARFKVQNYRLCQYLPLGVDPLAKGASVNDRDAPLNVYLNVYM